MAPFKLTLVLLVAATCSFTSISGAGVIDARLQRRFLDGIGGGGGDSGGSEEDNPNVMVSFEQSIQSVIDQINQQEYDNDDEKRTAQTDAQVEFTEVSQAGLKSFLDAQGVQSESFWISNRMYVPNASPDLVNAIANFPGVASVEEEQIRQLDNNGEFGSAGFNHTVRDNSTAEWGVEMIRAVEVWSELGNRGEGVVVANIDTGVRYTHEALRDNWREAYGWFDPYLWTRTPIDLQGHGTHVMGTIAGANGVGVAPGATWMACMGCTIIGCRDSHLLACGQFIQCPFKANNPFDRNCSYAPDVVCNSWGGGNDDTWYDDVINSWQSAGIIPVFAIGNSGPFCNSANSPGDRPNVIAVGNTDINDRIASSSSLGPTRDGRLKPEISAPGTDVFSASHFADDKYTPMTGTSMAAPHVTGVIALMMSKNPTATYTDIFNAIIRDPVTTVDTTDARTCGNIAPSSFPNNVFGYGRIDAFNAVEGI